MGTEWSWLRIGIGAGTCEYGNELSGSIKLAAEPFSFSRRTLLLGVSN